NKDEAIELVISHKDYKKKTNRFLNNSNNLLKCLKEMGPSIVVITKGKDGADCYDGNKFYHQKSLVKTIKVDTTGVGDAFNSSFVAGLEIYKGDIKKSLKLGAKNSASVITKQGAQNGLLIKKNI
ncbi:carbohydrate kinase family protein, partial [bacterium]|nr:carbohydrate kinase family protein [bacterium]